MRIKLRKAAPVSSHEQNQPKKLQSRLAKLGSSVSRPPKASKQVDMDPLIEAEDLEIKRLEKLLGIGKSEIVYVISND
jgi:hypothetical protein